MQQADANKAISRIDVALEVTVMFAAAGSRQRLKPRIKSGQYRSG